ncbi:hypothetical protein A2U01_0033294 [Trifolium medium]|uniref:Uncharacterized protein n=1 Tax=Trifolium medium TaxID=97028 RepID=A0A392PJD7_9FABA|nr:hypothetical protein [Trifolium medium]
MVEALNPPSQLCWSCRQPSLNHNLNTTGAGGCEVVVDAGADALEEVVVLLLYAPHALLAAVCALEKNLFPIGSGGPITSSYCSEGTPSLWHRYMMTKGWPMYTSDAVIKRLMLRAIKLPIMMGSPFRIA